MKIEIRRRLLTKPAALCLLLVACRDSGADRAAVPFSELRGISLGMSRSEVLSVHPEIFDNSGDLELTLGPHRKAFFVFAHDLPRHPGAPDRLVGVVVSRTFAPRDTLGLRSSVDSIADFWTRHAGTAVHDPAVELPPRLQMVYWTLPIGRIILVSGTDDSPFEPIQEMSVIFQARELSPGALLPKPSLPGESGVR